MSRPSLSIVIGYRNREPERVERCLRSLSDQTVDSFELIFVDYGSDRPFAEQIQCQCSSRPFCRHIYSETRGRPWSRPIALNIGIRQARSPFVLFSDVDMIFGRDFVKAIQSAASPDRILQCPCYWLPQGFEDWDRVDAHRDRLSLSNRAAKGGCQCVPLEPLLDLRGFDEFYRYWGIEDRDLSDRLQAKGLKEEWVEDQAVLFHQWHTRSDFNASAFLPIGYWARAECHYYAHHGQPGRNGSNWGRILTVSDRPTFKWLDFENKSVRRGTDLSVWNFAPEQLFSVSRIGRLIFDLPSGQAAAIMRTGYPRRSRALDRLLKAANRFLGTGARPSGFDYQRNEVNAFLCQFAGEESGIVRDYYFGFPEGNGVSLVVRA